MSPQAGWLFVCVLLYGLAGGALAALVRTAVKDAWPALYVRKPVGCYVCLGSWAALATTIIGSALLDASPLRGLGPWTMVWFASSAIASYVNERLAPVRVASREADAHVVYGPFGSGPRPRG